MSRAGSAFVAWALLMTASPAQQSAGLPELKPLERYTGAGLRGHAGAVSRLPPGTTMKTSARPRSPCK